MYSNEFDADCASSSSNQRPSLPKKPVAPQQNSFRLSFNEKEVIQREKVNQRQFEDDMRRYEAEVESYPQRMQEWDENVTADGLA